MPKVYVILVNWNNWPDTVKCLRSLRELDYPNCRVVVVDNGSTDDSVLRLAAEFPAVEMLRNDEDLGFAGGNNPGIRRGLDDNAEYVWLLNNDTVVRPDSLHPMVRLAETDPSVGVVGSVLYYMHDPRKIQTWGGGRIRPWLGISRCCRRPDRPERLSYISGASMLLRAQAIRQTGLLDEAFFLYWEDADLCRRLCRAGWKLAVAPDSTLLHKEMASYGAHSPTLDGYFNASAVRYFRRHAPLPAVPIVIGTAGRLAKRLARGRWRQAKAAFLGALRGCRG